MKLDGVTIEVVLGDISECDTDAIVNAANDQYIMGGGVAALIKKKGGQSIEDEALRGAPAELGQASLSKAGSLKARYVIHAVTMKMDFKTDAEIIRAATYNSILKAHSHKLKSIAFCALGCGTGKFNPAIAAKIMAQEVFRYLKQADRSEHSLERIVFVLNKEEVRDIFSKNIVTYLDYMEKKISEGPYVTVDAIVEYQEGIVIVERSNPPLGWALPGGFVDYGESLEEAVVREVKEETGLDFLGIKQLMAYSEPQRDPRFHTVSVAFSGQGQGILQAASDAKSAKVVKPESIVDGLAFDHGTIVRDYLKERRP